MADDDSSVLSILGAVALLGAGIYFVPKIARAISASRKPVSAPLPMSVTRVPATTPATMPVPVPVSAPTASAVGVRGSISPGAQLYVTFPDGISAYAGPANTYGIVAKVGYGQAVIVDQDLGNGWVKIRTTRAPAYLCFRDPCFDVAGGPWLSEAVPPARAEAVQVQA